MMVMKGALKIKVFQDGGQFCALVGKDLQTGSAGFGDTPTQALRRLIEVMEREGWNAIVGESVDPDERDLVIVH